MKAVWRAVSRPDLLNCSREAYERVGWSVWLGRVGDPDVRSGSPQRRNNRRRCVMFDDEVGDVGRGSDVESGRCPDLGTGQHQGRVCADIEQTAFEVDIGHVEAGNAMIERECADTE